MTPLGGAGRKGPSAAADIAAQRRPNFFLAGSFRSGTTAMASYLAGHPRVFVCNPKEPNFFASDMNPGPIDSLPRYLRLFEDALPQHRILCDASVRYLCSRTALRQLQTFEPRARILVMLRNPMEMIPSFHNLQLAAGREDEKDLGRAWALQDARRRGEAVPRKCPEPYFLQYREIAGYGRQIELLLQLFDRQQVAIELFDDFRRDPGEVYRRVLAFLELEDDRRQDFPRVNEAFRIRSPALARIGNLNSYGADLALKRLKRALGLRRIGLRAWLQTLSTSRTGIAALDLGLEEEIRDTLREDVAKLSSLIERDLSIWGF